MATRSDAAWFDLSPTYRARLQRAGITLEDYIAGVPLRSARGQSKAEPKRLVQRKELRTSEKVAMGVTSETLERRRKRFFGRQYAPPSKRRAGQTTRLHDQMVENWQKVIDSGISGRDFNRIMLKTELRRQTPGRHRSVNDIVISEEIDDLFWYHMA